MTLRADKLIIDGRHLLWRASDVHKGLSVNLDGIDVPTGGMYGFLSVLIRVHARYGGEVLVSWEGQGRYRPRNFRFGLFPSYKSKDEEAPPERLEFIAEMLGQEARLMDLLSHMGVKQYMGIGCEGDDVTGRLARECSEAGETVVIYSGDSDLRQLLVYDGVYIVAPQTIQHKVVDHIFDAVEAEAKHGVPPALIAQLKALVGGKDNLPGVKGVGKKIGSVLLNHYGSLQAVLRAALDEDDGWPSTPRIRLAIAQAAQDVITYYKVARIRTNVEFDHIEPERDQGAVVGLLFKYRFQSLLAPAELHALMSLAGV